VTQVKRLVRCLYALVCAGVNKFDKQVYSEHEESSLASWPKVLQRSKEGEEQEVE
jgi:hypothetical protein